MHTRTVLSVCAAIAISATSLTANAQGGRYGGGVIAPGSPPVTLTGTSGGPRSARGMGSQCRGTIAMTPDHIFTVTAHMQVRWEVLQASGDTTLVIMGPAGVMCDDDSGNGSNPRIIRQIPPGQYQVYVGSYSSGNMYPYTIQVHGMGGMHMPVPVAPPVAGGGRYGGAVLSPTSMVASLSGTSGGPRPGRTMGSHCRGHIANMPDHVITVTSPMVLTFDVSAPGDTTLIVAGPTGVHCNDDGGSGFNPRLTQPMQPGAYQIFVGSYSSSRFHPYTMTIHP